MKTIAILTMMFLPGAFIAVSMNSTGSSNRNINENSDSIQYEYVQLAGRKRRKCSFGVFLGLLGYHGADYGYYASDLDGLVSALEGVMSLGCAKLRQ
jgi:hypothetical protein